MTNEWNPQQGAAPRGLRPGQTGAPSRSPVDPAERRQRNLIIALSIGAVIVLIAGMIAFVATQDRGESTSPATVVTASTTAVVEESAPITAEETTTTTTSTVPPTTVVITANADAGEDLAVDQAVEFMLVARDLADGTPSEAVRWTQTAGPDVTAGVGSLRGAEALAIAPSSVSTLVFALEVAGTDGVATDEVIVRVFEDADEAIFVDGERGNDAGDGSIFNPFQSLPAAAQSADGRDIYIRSTGIYDTNAATLQLGNGVSLYGGFDENWMRDTARRAMIQGAAVAISTTGSASRSLSAVEVTAADAAPGEDSSGVQVTDAGIVRLLDSRVVAGDAGEGVNGDAGGHSAGMIVDGATDVIVERSTINAGRGGRGSDGMPAEDDTAESGSDGQDGDERNAGVGAGSGARAGGSGGDGGNTSNGSDADDGGVGGTPSTPNGRAGRGGSGGPGGAGGNGGSGAVTADDGATVPVGRVGVAGDVGSDGSGGRGGGGGNGPVGVDGGGGGGGGLGGSATAGGLPGNGGGGSIGLWTVDVESLVIIESLIAGGRAGNGGIGAPGLPGSVGGAGGDGAAGFEGPISEGGAGGGGGGGGAGGTGGQGGGGGGGPSYGLLTTRTSVNEVVATTVRGGAGGNGADGGTGGSPGLGGQDGTGRDGGDGGASSSEVNAEAGVGASGGASYGWFDDSGADRDVDADQFVEGAPGSGGNGSSPGEDGAEGATD